MKSLFLCIVIAAATGLFAQQQQGNQQAQQQSAAPGQPGPHVPTAKTPAEYQAFTTAAATTGGAAAEAAADDFATKFPQSELRENLYLKAMQEYQQQNLGPKILAMGEKVLAVNPENSTAL